jgi:hypothetical protein
MLICQSMYLQNPWYRRERGVWPFPEHRCRQDQGPWLYTSASLVGFSILLYVFSWKTSVTYTPARYSYPWLQPWPTSWEQSHLYNVLITLKQLVNTSLLPPYKLLHILYICHRNRHRDIIWYSRGRERWQLTRLQLTHVYALCKCSIDCVHIFVVPRGTHITCPINCIVFEYVW